MAKLVIHAGFHKTATTTVQRFFWQNRRKIWRKFGYPSADKYEPIWRAAGGYSTYRDDTYLTKVKLRTHSFLLSRDIGKHRDFLISSERLSGHMPGRMGLADYSAVVPLMATIYDASKDVLPHHDVVFYFSTRENCSWMKSAYAQHVKGSHMVLEFEDFVAKFPNAANFDEVLQDLRAALPKAQVIDCDHKQASDMRFGPATPILDLFDLPLDFLDGLEMVPSANRRLPDHLTSACLAINRRVDNADEAKRAKDALIREYFQSVKQ